MTSAPINMKNSILKETREGKGLTLEMVHESTKIPMDALRAIEEGYSIRILTPFYYKGFVKNYAEFLNLDVDMVFKEYNLDRATKPHVVEVQSKPQRFKHHAGEKTADALAGLFTPQRRKIILNVFVVVICLFFAVKIFAWMGGKIKSAFSKPRQQKEQLKSEKKTPVKKQEVKKAATTPQVKKNQTPVQVVETREALEDFNKSEEKAEKISNSRQETSIAKKVRLTVKAKKDSWLRVKSDGEVVFQSTLRKGSSESWGANEEIELSGKNINLLEFEVNGKLLGLLGSSDRKAKKVIITKDGLSVKK